MTIYMQIPYWQGVNIGWGNGFLLALELLTEPFISKLSYAI